MKSLKIFPLFTLILTFSSCCLTRPLIYPDNPYFPPLAKAPEGFKQVTLEICGDDKVDAWLQECSDKDAPLVVFLYGNAQNLHQVFQTGLYNDFTRLGCHMVCIDYPGYGNSEGPTTDDRTIKAAHACINWAETYYKNNKIIVCGWSLGTGIAIQATKYNPKVDALLLFAPYTSISDLAKEMVWSPLVWFFLWDDYKTLEDADKIHCPCFVVHGKKDLIIPVNHSRKIVKKLKDVTYVEVEDGRHDGIFSTLASQKALKEFLKRFK